MSDRHHLGNVVPMQRPGRKPRPAVQPTLYDHQEEQAAGDKLVLLRATEAQAIAGLLRSARQHLPSPGAVDEAIALLRGGR